MCKAKVLICIVPEARLQRNPSPSRSTPIDFSKCYHMCANRVAHLLDSSIIPISIYYGHMIAMEGVATPKARCMVKP
jgi:hypothetical protein